MPSVRKLRLGPATRDAVPASPNSAFECTAAAIADRLVVSVGAEAPPGVNPAGAEFLVETRSGSGWGEILRVPSTEAVGQWKTLTVPLKSKATVTLRFQVQSVQQNPPDGATYYWGSPLLLGKSKSFRPLQDRSQLPNVILVSFDTLRARELGWYGGLPLTPNFDRFLERSFVFRRAFSQFPSTLSSHATLFSGLYPKNHRAYPTSKFRGTTSFAGPSLVSTLAEHQYVTLAVTEDGYVASDFGFDRGFDLFDNGAPHEDSHALSIFSISGDAEATFSRAREWLQLLGETRFFLFLHTYEVHTPYVLRDRVAERVTRALSPGYQGRFAASFDFGLPGFAHNSGEATLDPAELRQLQALYAAEVNYLDRKWAQFAAFLENRGFLENTLVILTSDHGEEFGEHGPIGHGESLYDDVLHVPLAFRWDGRIRPGSTDVPVGLVDVAPTLLDLLGLQPQHCMDGISLVPLIRRAGKSPVGRVVYSELDTAPGQCKRLGKEDGCLLDRIAVHDGRFKLLRSRLPYWEHLYDLESDPGETSDVSAKFPGERERLSRLAGTYHQTGCKTSAEKGRDATLDAHTEERLRILGYQ
jgi:arylsulfatase A-like enzyme